MAELIASGPLDGLGPTEAAGCTLDVLALGRVAAILPWPGRVAAADAALRARGLGFPPPGGSVEVADTRIVWAGRDMALLIGAPLTTGAEAAELAEAAVIDQTDGWAGLSLSGPGAEAVLARLVPVDLRPAAFAEGAAARTLLNQIACLILRRGGGFEILVMSSFARSAWDEILRAMTVLAARPAGGEG